MMAIPWAIIDRQIAEELCRQVESAPIRKFQLTTIKTSKGRNNEKDQSEQLRKGWEC
jgi:hypothetical protein